MGLHHPAELGFPVAVQHRQVDVALPRVGGPQAGLGGGEVHVLGRPGGDVGVQQRPDRTLPTAAGDGGGDPVAGHVGQRLVHQLRRVGSALADQVTVEPLRDHALQPAEEVQLEVLVIVPPLGLQQAAGEVVGQAGNADLSRVD